MATPACRDVLKGLSGAENAALLLARYLMEVAKSDGDAQAARSNLFESAQNALKLETVQGLYEKAFNQRSKALDRVSSSRRFETENRLVIGLGSSNVLETGITLNPIFGTPLIPGSSIKGVVAHYCSLMLGPSNPDFRGPAIDEKNNPTQQAGPVYEALFGKSCQHSKERGIAEDVTEDAGYVRFYDAWMIPQSLKSALQNEVMTPHHGDYYTKGKSLPTDFDDPNPVTYLAVSGVFDVRIAVEEPNIEERTKWEKLVFQLLEDALKYFGIGGKGSSGYGRLIYKETENEKKQKAVEEKNEQNKALGFYHNPGEQITLQCIERKEVKGKIKCKFEKVDNKDARFEPSISNVAIGETQKGIIDRIDVSQKAYILKRI